MQILHAASLCIVTNLTRKLGFNFVSKELYRVLKWSKNLSVFVANRRSLVPYPENSSTGHSLLSQWKPFSTFTFFYFSTHVYVSESVSSLVFRLKICVSYFSPLCLVRMYFISCYYVSLLQQYSVKNINFEVFVMTFSSFICYSLLEPNIYLSILFLSFQGLCYSFNH